MQNHPFANDPVTQLLQQALAEGQSKTAEEAECLRHELEKAQLIITLQESVAALLEAQVKLLKARLKSLGWPGE